MKIPIFVINLDRAPNRWAHMQNMLQQHGLVHATRVSAVDGKMLSDADVNEIYDEQQNRKKYFSPLKRAEIACFMSHRQMWQQMVDNQIAYACVLEDDVAFTQDPTSLFDAFKPLLDQPEPVAIRLYSKKPVAGMRLDCLLPSPYSVISPKLAPLGTQGYVVNRAAASVWLEKTSCIYEPIDVALQRHWDLGFKTLQISPSALSEVSQTLGGTTLHSQQKLTLASRIKREFARPMFRVKRWIRSRLKLW